MNERIKELALEVFSFKYKTAPNELNPGHQMDHIHKFAELIVRECLNICAEREQDIRTRIKDEGKAATAYMIRAYIKEHFGVSQ